MNNEPGAVTNLSHYRIISKIGSGGMGEVYLAEDTGVPSIGYWNLEGSYLERLFNHPIRNKDKRNSRLIGKRADENKIQTALAASFVNAYKARSW